MKSLLSEKRKKGKDNKKGEKVRAVSSRVGKVKDGCRAPLEEKKCRPGRVGEMLL